MRLIVYKNELVTNTVIMHLSCKCSWWTFLGTYSRYVLWQADSACKNVRNLVHDVVPWKRYVLQGTWSFGMFRPFWNGLSVVHFSVDLAIIRRPADTFHVELVHASARVSCAGEISRWCVRSHLATACMIARTIFSSRPGFEPLALHVIDFYGSRVWIPARAARSFRGSRVRFLGPDHLFSARCILGLRHSPPQMEQQVAPQNKKNSYQR